jgi:hypothetical protein
MIVIYEISDPISDIPRYIGQTNNLQRRISNHLSVSRNNTNKINWRLRSFIKNLLNQGLTPIFTIIDSVDESISDETETYWISQYKQWGFELFNISEGGRRFANFTPWNKGLRLTEDHKAALSKSHKNTKQSESQINARFKNIRENGNPRKGSCLSAHTKELISQSRKRRTIEQLDMNETLIATHISLMSIKRLMKLNTIQSIVNCCKNRPNYKTAYGYKWKYATT